MNNKKRFIEGALVGALVTLLLTGIVFFGFGHNVVSLGAVYKLSQLKGLIDENYLGKADGGELKEGIYKGYLEALDDPYSIYYDAQETKQLNERLSGQFNGIGALLTQDKDTGVITLIRIYKDSPAMDAGLKDGDILYQIEGRDVTGEDLNQVVNDIKGDRGTKVNLTVIRGSDDQQITVNVTRDVVEKQTVDSRMLEDGIGYLAVSEFDSVTYSQYKEALDDLENQGAGSLVIDLRNNPGGNLDIVCEMLDLILPKGVIVYTEDKNGERKEYTSDSNQQVKMPIAVLMNGQSASASEIFAAAVQDYDRGQIVGTQSYGKGVVQKLYDLMDGSCVKLTSAEYFTPEGRKINGKGVTPDVEVEYEYDPNHPEADHQLEKAIETLKTEYGQKGLQE